MTRTSLSLHREDLASPIGTVVMLTDDEGRLRALDFDDYAERMHRLLDRHYGRDGWSLGPATRRSAALDALEAYFEGDVRALACVLAETNGSLFQRKVWAALREVPEGTTRSYGALAAAIGQPAAVRAVGLANGANPVAIVVPCHRVIGADGSLTGYGGGLERKRWLLDHERRHAGADLLSLSERIGRDGRSIG